MDNQMSDPFSKINLLREQEAAALAAAAKKAQQPQVPLAGGATFDAVRRAQQEAEVPKATDPRIPITADTPWSTVGEEALKSLPESAWKFGVGVTSPIHSPIQTAKSLYGLGEGLVSKAAGLFVEQDPEEKAKAEAVVNALGGDYAKRFGSWRGFKQAVARDPVGMVGDISAPLTLGGGAAVRGAGIIGKAGKAASTAGIIEKAGKAASTVGKYIDPFTPVVLAGRQAIAATRGFTSLSGAASSGTSAAAMNKAYQSGMLRQPDFVEYMRGNKTGSDLIDAAENAMFKAIAQKNADYVQNTANMRSISTPVSYGGIEKAILAEARKNAPINYKSTNSQVLSALREVQDVVNQWKSQPVGGQAHTIMDLDGLKRRIYDIKAHYEGAGKAGSPAATAVEQVRKTVFAEIARIDPSYARAMEEYATAKYDIDQLRRNMVGSDRLAEPTRVRKILNQFNKSTNGELMKFVEKIDPALPYKIAGYEASAWLPKGAAGIAAAIMSQAPIAISMMTGDIRPALMAPLTLAATSPRTMGETARAIGKLRTGDAFPKTRAVGHLIQPPEKEEARPLTIRPDREGRATGGSVNGAVNLRVLANAARKQVTQSTEEFLKESDDQVAKALEIANQQI